METRWNSLYDIIARILEPQAPIFATSLEQKGWTYYQRIMNSYYQKKLLVLTPFKDVTAVVCSKVHYVTVSAACIRPLNHLLDNVFKSSHSTESNALKSIKKGNDIKSKFSLPITSSF